MTFQANLPPSMVAKMAKSEEGDDGPKKQSREDWKKMKELDEMRKAGTAPAMQDEEGREINPHIPQYIMQAPWYYGSTSATLKHQRPQDDKNKSYSTMHEWYKKGIKEGPIATKFRKGACENCGAMTHKKKDCLERPRKVGAKFTGESIAPDEYIQDNLDFDYEGKRDRWNGINTEEHRQKIFEDHNKIEAAKRVLKEQKLDAGIDTEEGTKDEDDAEAASDDDDEDKYADDMLMPGQKFETKQRITVRNLRIREDTAKYLYNLDLNSAFYDPKTRSMRQNPFETSGKDKADLHYAGDNFVRVSGDAYEMSKEQLFAWEAYERGVDVHIQADPTKLALLKKEFIQRKDTFKETAKQSILDKYGGEEHLEAPPKELLLAQTENYVEYSRHGAVIKGQEKVAIKSRYEEFVHINNHTSVWGSYWFNGQWGFSCCHSLVKESYCTGEAGKQASVSSKELMLQQQKEYDAEETPKSLMELHHEDLEKKRKKKKKKDKKKKKKKKKNKDNSDSDSSESDDPEEKLKKALKKEDNHNRDIEKLMALDERKRPYNSMFEAKEPTEEEMQAYLMKRRRLEDPMAAFLTK